MSNPSFTSKDRRKDSRVKFDSPINVKLMAIDGTWSRECRLIDMSSTGACVVLTTSAAGLTEFFLVLTHFGLPVFRRCRMEWVNGATMGVIFVTTRAAIKSLDDLRRDAELA